uniref:Protein Skeletor n=1 Tax=Syphacia muris TaxID=451379 RepID=A0A158R4J2_9BILA
MPLVWPTRTIFALLGSVVSGVIGDQYNTSINTYNKDYGVYIGKLTDPSTGEIKGYVFVVNETTLQILNFTYTNTAPDAYFWLDRNESPTKDGLKLPTFEYGLTPIKEYNNSRVVLVLPGFLKIKSFKSFSLYCLKFAHSLGSIIIPESLLIPKVQFLTNGAGVLSLKGSRYNVDSGPLLVIDRKTIKIFGFKFDGHKAPDAYFFVGRGPNVAHNAGIKVPIRGRDTPELITAMSERYRGGQDIIVDLPDDYDVYHIDWLSIYCYKFRVDFGHVPITNISQLIPPYVPPQKRHDDIDFSKIQGWKATSLLGSEKRRSFTFQLGPPGGRRGYQSMAQAHPSKYVWYVNGYLADVYLKRGVNYTFNVEGGADKSTVDFYNPLYISTDPFGGYSKLSDEERKQVTIIAGEDSNQTAGRLCLWSQTNDTRDPDKYDKFTSYRQTLKLHCDKSPKTATFTFTPDSETPDTLYYQSYSNYNMGWKIHVVDELPTDIEDFDDEPYHDLSSLSSSGSTSIGTKLSLVLLANVLLVTTHLLLCIA